MEEHKNKMTILVGEINRINEENQNLNSMLKRMSTSYNDLQKHITSLGQRKQQQTFVDRIQTFNPDDLNEDNFSLRMLSSRSVDVRGSGNAVFHQSYDSWNSRKRVPEKEGKKAKFMDDQQLPSKKRKINYIQLDQTQNGVINSSMDDSLGAVSQQSYDSSDCSQQVRKKEGKNAKFLDDQQLPSKKRTTRNGMTLISSMDDGLICDKPPKKKHKALKKGSNKQTATAPRTRSEAFLINIDAEPLYYLQTKA